jgi:hypothetical protein
MHPSRHVPGGNLVVPQRSENGRYIRQSGPVTAEYGTLEVDVRESSVRSPTFNCTLRGGRHKAQRCLVLDVCVDKPCCTLTSLADMLCYRPQGDASSWRAFQLCFCCSQPLRAEVDTTPTRGYKTIMMAQYQAVRSFTAAHETGFVLQMRTQPGKRQVRACIPASHSKQLLCATQAP